MKLHTIRRTSGIIATTAALALGTVACSSGSGSGEDAAAKSAPSASASEDSMAEDQPTPSDTESDTESQGASAGTFGPGCSQIPTSGAGSFDGMVNDPVATAASNNPLLSTLVTAVGAIDGLADTLNGQEALTVFAPYNEAFAAIPEKDLNMLVKEGQAKGQDSALYTVLAHHVLAENADPTAVTGEKKTLASDTLTVEGDPEQGMTVSDGTVTATVLCGNIPTANATVYVIDKVLTGIEQ